MDKLRNVENWSGFQNWVKFGGFNWVRIHREFGNIQPQNSDLGSEF
jgi:hypothetical protein